MNRVQYLNLKTMSSPLQLPPGLSNAIPQATLTLSFPKLLFCRLNLSSLTSTFKFWGQPSAHIIDWNSRTALTYTIVTSYQNLLKYLKDMKILIIQFRDNRTGRLVASGILNFVMILNGFEWIDGEWSVDIQQKKTKVGQFLVKMQYREGFRKEPSLPAGNNGSSAIGGDHSNRFLPSSSLRQQNGRKMEYNPSPKSPEHRRHKEEIQQIAPFEPKPKSQRKRDILLQFKEQGLFDHPTISTLPRLNFQYQASKLKLEQMELLGTPSASNEIHLVFSHLMYPKNPFTSNSAYQLLIDFPIIAGKQSKTNTFTIWSLSSEGSTVEFNQRVSIVVEDQKLTNEQLKEYLNGKVSLQLLEAAKGEMKPKSSAALRLADLLSALRGKRQIKLSLMRKTKQKEEVDCELVIKQQTLSTESTANASKEASEVSIKKDPSVCPQANQKHMNLQLTIYIAMLRLVKPLHSPSLYVRLRIGESIFKGQPHWNVLQPNFDMLVHVPVPPIHKRDFVVVQIWNKKAEEYLVGTANIELDKLNNFIGVPENCKVGSSLLPYIYIDESKEVRTLKQALIGYLDLKLAVGTPQQIFNFNREIAEGRERRRQNRYKTDPSENTNSNRGNTQNKNSLDQVKHNTNQFRNRVDTNTNRLDTNNRIDTYNEEQQSPLITDPNNPAHMSSISSDSKIHIIDELPTPPAPLSTILHYLIYQFSLNQNYYKLLDHLLNKGEYLSMSQFVALIKGRFALNFSQYDASRLSFFFAKDLKIRVSSFTKSIQSYRQYQELLNEQYNPVLKKLKAEMDYELMSVNMLEIHMKKYGNSGLLNKLQFKESVLQMLKMTLLEIEKLYEFSKNQKGDVEISEFCNSLRKYDVYDSIRSHRYPFSTFSSFMFLQLESILQQMPEILELIIASHSSAQEVISSHQLAQMFQGADAQLSLWEAFIIIEKLKERMNQTKFDQGLISRQLVTGWLEKLMPTKIFRSPTFGLIQNGKATQRRQAQQRREKLKSLLLEFSFPVKPIQIRVFGESVQMEQQSMTGVVIKVGQQRQTLVLQIVTRDQILRSEGRVGQWMVVSEEGNYVGDLIIH